MSRHPGGERYEIVLVAQPGDAPSHVRLKLWLKSALRSARMRCTSVRQLPATPTASQDATGGTEATARPSGENGPPAKA